MTAAEHGDLRTVDGTTAPRWGEVVVLRMDGRDRVLWWGPHGDVDRFATTHGRLATWPSVDACTAFARRAGLTGLDDGAPDAEIGRSTIDVHPAQAWLRTPGTPLDPVAALGLWNCRWDVEATRTGAHPVLTRHQRGCHQELTFANVPWLVGAEVHRPRWTAADLSCLRQVLGDAVHVLRAALARGQPRQAEHRRETRLTGPTVGGDPRGRRPEEPW